MLLLPRGKRSEGDYKALVKALSPAGPAAGRRRADRGRTGDVRKLGADGLHVSGGLDALQEAVEALKPDFIVGAGGFATKHEAMEAGELDVDYVFFGPLSGPIEPAARELARWWAETMDRAERSVRSRGGRATADAEGCEFIALGERLWQERVA